MKKISAAFFVLAVSVCAFLLREPISAQQLPTNGSGSAVMAQDQTAPPQANPIDPNESKTFTGKIVKSGDKLVLTDAMSNKVYQLDDQTKAKEFLNKNVKVTGNLDGSTSTIRISSIDPM